MISSAEFVERRMNTVMQLQEISERLEKLEEDFKKLQPMVQEIHDMVSLGKSFFKTFGWVAWALHKVFKWAAPIIAVIVTIYTFLHSGVRPPSK